LKLHEAIHDSGYLIIGHTCFVKETAESPAWKTERAFPLLAVRSTSFSEGRDGDIQGVEFEYMGLLWSVHDQNLAIWRCGWTYPTEWSVLGHGRFMHKYLCTKEAQKLHVNNVQIYLHKLVNRQWQSWKRDKQGEQESIGFCKKDNSSTTVDTWRKLLKPLFQDKKNVFTITGTVIVPPSPLPWQYLPLLVTRPASWRFTNISCS
jgi:hypothetical protein